MAAAIEAAHTQSRRGAIKRKRKEKAIQIFLLRIIIKEATAFIPRSRRTIAMVVIGYRYGSRELCEQSKEAINNV